jgi:hypothetical protein
MTLYTYCLRIDDGAAPNPYWGVSTLVICKPAIRRVAQPGDWVVGLGSAVSPVGDLSGQVVYAMRIAESMPMEAYDRYCQDHLPAKIPRWESREFKKRVGDCIYDFSSGAVPSVRTSVHTEQNREVDLGGKNALLSDHFYYFGNHPRPLPPRLSPIVHQTQGHRSRANAEYVDSFAEWIEGLGLKPNRLYGTPQHKHLIMTDPEAAGGCSVKDLDEDRDDAVC